MFHSPATQEFICDSVPPFSEMIISWNGPRPQTGQGGIYVRVLIDEWTLWIEYMTWGADEQSSHKTQAGPVRVYQDLLEVLNGQEARGFQVKADQPLRFHVFTNGDNKDSPDPLPTEPVYVPVAGLSQMALQHPRHRDLCSPTSTSAVVRFLTQKAIDPVQFAEKVRDHGFDIYGNWVFNLAESSQYLGPSWNTWVERLQGFAEIHRRLLLGTPVIVSVRGPLPGSAQPYAHGHLLVVSGFDPKTGEVHCMDPAFPSDEQTHVRYRLDDFVTAWERRGRVAYIFEKMD
ncbi:MAG: C39 family peptidase [Verrucomicrobia bacterium]|nr:C39 family peptidase [Verrucomicrobiota bacterium]MBU6446159.1 C39 family peptidase [Verrucomicrobiota bacterium]MDE3047104.1 C39 family peptidase [Verrucomicrobiota bacterium]